MNIEPYVVRNLPDYIKLVIELNTREKGEAWFRGHSSGIFRLIPGALRELVPSVDSRGNLLKGGEILLSSGYSLKGPDPDRMLDDFKRKARPFITEVPRNDFEWLFLMQHHGVPTRLLDWTENALVALYFATESINPKTHKSNRSAAKRFLDGDEFREDGAAVYMINPVRINHECAGIDDVVDVAGNFECWSHYARPMNPTNLSTFLPICITATHVSPRIRAQSGLFTLHGQNVWPLDYYDALRPLISKIFIPYNVAIQIKRDLAVLGMTRSFVFPDLDGVAREISEKEKSRFAQIRR